MTDTDIYRAWQEGSSTWDAPPPPQPPTASPKRGTSYGDEASVTVRSQLTQVFIFIVLIVCQQPQLAAICVASAVSAMAEALDRLALSIREFFVENIFSPRPYSPLEARSAGRARPSQSRSQVAAPRVSTMLGRERPGPIRLHPRLARFQPRLEAILANEPQQQPPALVSERLPAPPLAEADVADTSTAATPPAREAITGPAAASPDHLLRML